MNTDFYYAIYCETAEAISVTSSRKSSFYYILLHCLFILIGMPIHLKMTDLTDIF